jgi:hypothetical protein
MSGCRILQAYSAMRGRLPGHRMGQHGPDGWTAAWSRRLSKSVLRDRQRAAAGGEANLNLTQKRVAPGRHGGRRGA